MIVKEDRRSKRVEFLKSLLSTPASKPEPKVIVPVGVVGRPYRSPERRAWISTWEGPKCSVYDACARLCAWMNYDCIFRRQEHVK
jgi:hypothetical protein